MRSTRQRPLYYGHQSLKPRPEIVRRWHDPARQPIKLEAIKLTLKISQLRHGVLEFFNKKRHPKRGGVCTVCRAFTQRDLYQIDLDQVKIHLFIPHSHVLRKYAGFFLVAKIMRSLPRAQKALPCLRYFETSQISFGGFSRCQTAQLFITEGFSPPK